MRRALSVPIILIVLGSAQPATRGSPDPKAVPAAAEAAADRPSCDCCVFDEAPPSPAPRLSLAGDGEPGPRIEITGTVYQSDGRTPAPGVLMYFYHTDSTGHYTKRGDEDRSSFAWWHGTHRGWLRTDAEGRYTIRTIKPAPYPDHTEPAHIHCMVQPPSQRHCYYLADYVFKGDPLLTERYWRTARDDWERIGIGEDPDYGGLELTAGPGGILLGRRDIVLLKEYDNPPLDSGRPIGEENPAFDPQHVWGPDKGSHACPMCKYGFLPGVLYWVGSDDRWEEVGAMAKFLEQESDRRGDRRFKAYLIYTNPGRRPIPEVESKLTRLAEAQALDRIAVTYVPSPVDSKTAILNQINPAARNTVIVFRKRRVIDKFVDFEPTERNLKLLRASVDRAASGG